MHQNPKGEDNWPQGQREPDITFAGLLQQKQQHAKEQYDLSDGMSQGLNATDGQR